MQRHFACLTLLALTAPVAFAQNKNAPPDTTVWTDVKSLDMEGKGFSDTKSFFDRLPARAEAKVRGAVWGLSRHSAGLAVRFVTDAPAIHAKWMLTSAKLEMPHMPATGVSGLDLYVRSDRGWRWVNNGRPSATNSTATFVSGLPQEKREYLLYLPLYNGVSSLEIGTPKGHAVDKSNNPPYPAGYEKPIVFYGTSITHGACASRPGMAHTAILGRWLNRPVINLGFSGNGKMEPEVVDFIAEIDAAAYVIDCLPNMTATEVAQRTEPLIHQFRKTRPTTPIVLVEDRTYPNGYLVKSLRERNDTSRAALKAAYENLKKANVSGLFYITGEDLIGRDTEGTVDNSHPSDLGFWRQAEAMAPILRSALGQ
jgi:hypothetical protein